MNKKHKAEGIASVIQIYTSWKASQSTHEDEQMLIQQKLNPKFEIANRVQPTFSPLPVQSNLIINKIVFNSTELIPESVLENYNSVQTEGWQTVQPNVSLQVKRKSSLVSLGAGHKTVPQFKTLNQNKKAMTISIRLRGSSQQNVISGEQYCRSFKPVLNPQKRQFRVRKSLDLNVSPRHNQKVQLQEQFFESKKGKDKWLKEMIISDLELLKIDPHIDMDLFVLKIKNEQRMRKNRAISRWQTFNYEEIST